VEEVGMGFFEAEATGVVHEVMGEGFERTAVPDAFVVVSGLPNDEVGIGVTLSHFACYLRFESAEGNAEVLFHVFFNMQDAVDVVWHDAEGGCGNLGVIVRDVVPFVEDEPSVGVKEAGVVFAGAE
jgi:hypothetical protein